MEQIEINTIDKQLERTRRRDATLEKRLLISIQERDIQDPLQIVPDHQQGRFILIDGFKRLRCAVKLGIPMVPVEHIGSDIIIGILTMLRRDASKGICTFEQAALIDELHKQYSLSIYDIATRLDRSPSWVSMRLGLFDEMSPLVRDRIMSGAFPARAYMYDIKRFTRVNKIGSQRVTACVAALSGKKLSTRDLSILSRAYFTGGESLERLITDGDVHSALRMLKGTTKCSQSALSVKEQRFLDDLKTMVSVSKRIINTASVVDNSLDIDLLSSVNVWCASLMSTMLILSKAIKELYEKTISAGNGDNTVPAGAKQEVNCPSAQN
jgi:ParB/RepB/Spo0J family partition protein